MKSRFYLPLLFGMAMCSHQMNKPVIPTPTYPVTRQAKVSDNFFGTNVNDPYRWLEDDTAAEVVQWVKDQNKITFDYLNQIPGRDNLKKRLNEIWNFPKFGAPFKEGDYYYFSKNNGLQNQSVIYRTKDLRKPEQAELFLDPNQLSDDGTVSLASLTFSKDHKYAAVGIAKSGSDWNEIFVLETATLKKTGDQIRWVKFSAATWKGNGFFYSRYDEPTGGKDFSNQNTFMKVYYHQMGNTQDKDVLIYEDREHPLRYFNAAVTEDERFLFINISEGTSGNEILYQELSNENEPIKHLSQGVFHLLCKGFENNYDLIDNEGSNILVRTDLNAPKYRVVSIDPKQPDPANWKTVIPESSDLLESVTTAGNQLVVNYLKDASTRIKCYDRSGKFLVDITLPGIGTASTRGCKKEETLLPYHYVSFTDPGTVKLYDLKTRTQESWNGSSTLAFNPADFETKQVFYPSKDGTRIPMFLMYKKGMVLNGNNPTLLYGYGGFNISLTPSFSVSRIAFLEQGGVYAIANLRGGGEYGEAWHKAGMLEKKQNVFDDFIAAAEYLIKEKYTSPSHLAIQGGSNGGLLVGACMTQRPELFSVAIPQVGVLDMLRYHKFTIGWGWAVEYGSSEKQDQFQYLMRYSPLHNVKKAKYPATLIMTADHDDRVVPAHSFKFAATLQQTAAKDSGPLLIRIDSKAGHGAGKPTAKLIEDAADMFGFILYHTR